MAFSRFASLNTEEISTLLSEKAARKRNSLKVFSMSICTNSPIPFALLFEYIIKQLLDLVFCMISRISIISLVNNGFQAF